MNLNKSNRIDFLEKKSRKHKIKFIYQKGISLSKLGTYIMLWKHITSMLECCRIKKLAAKFIFHQLSNDGF